MSLTLNHLPLEIFAQGKKLGEANNKATAEFIVNELIANGEIQIGHQIMVTNKATLVNKIPCVIYIDILFQKPTHITIK
jgi:hypothetical protein